MDTSIDALKGVPFLDLTDRQKVGDWLKIMKAVLDKSPGGPWKVLVRARLNDTRALTLLNLTGTFTVFASKIQELVKPEQTMYTANFAFLVDKLSTPSSPLVHLNNINEFSNEIVEMVREHIGAIPLPSNLDPAAFNLEDFRNRIAEDILGLVSTAISRDILSSLLRDSFSSKWDKSAVPLVADPVDIALWAETLQGSSSQVLRLTAKEKAPESAMSPAATKTTPAALDETPPNKKRKFSEKDRVYCEFCKREVTTHTPLTCYNNPANKTLTKEKKN